MNRNQILLIAEEANKYASRQPCDISEWHGIRDEYFYKLIIEKESEKWIKGAMISAPTVLIKQQFSDYYKRGYEAGKALTPAAVAAEREACAKVCEEHWFNGGNAMECVDAIRARSQ
jgi:hypothetical protein